MKNIQKTYHNVHEWTVDDVKQWLIEKGFDSQISQLFATHKIDGKALLTLREDDLRKYPLQLKYLGEIKKLYLFISHLQTINITFYSQMPSSTYLNLNNVNYLQLKEQLKSDLQNANHSNQIQSNLRKRHIQHLTPVNDEETSISSIPEELSEVDEENDFHLLRLPNGKYQEFKPEIWKAFVAMVYFFAVTWITAIVMVIVHDRVPDMAKYPPLPDIFLDNVPMIPFAFVMCELCGLILFIISILLLVFHKHRFILIRRMFSLFGSVFLLRCVTMLITSLSVPGRHLNCNPRPYGNWYDKIKQAFLIWQGAGMSINSVRTCGDYMFSGHTVTLTLLNFFITEYTPRNLYFVHTLSWVLNLFGVFFILAGHEHYSIDVFIAFYISTRLFLYYHTLANNRCLYSSDRRRTRIWFPLFYFFESGVNGIVPNVFSIPLGRKLRFWLHKMRTFDSPSFNSIHYTKLNGYSNGQSNHLNSNRLNNSNSTLDHSGSKSSSKDLKASLANRNDIKNNNSIANSNDLSRCTRAGSKRKNKKTK